MDENLVETEFKYSHGEINTPFSFAKKMIDMFPPEFLRENHKWLDPGCGQGNISYTLYNSLCKYHNKDKILKEMIHMVEINKERENAIRNRFENKPFLNINIVDFMDFNETGFDAIICNPPFNFGGCIKTPTNKSNTKKNDGYTAWCKFITHSMTLLRENGYLCIIVPSMWLKPDKAGMYYYLLQYKIEKMMFFTNTETNHIFRGQAQTPTTLFLLKKQQSKERILSLFCNEKREYIKYALKKDFPIPTTNFGLINKLMEYVNKVGHIKVFKTNMPSKFVSFSLTSSEDFKYKNIKTVITHKNKESATTNDTFETMNGIIAEKQVNWSDKPCIGYNRPKIILAHKMYGYPLLDIKGEYGVSNRDNFIITEYNEQELERIAQFLSLPFIIKIYDATRYRMRYLEKYAFNFIPDITKLQDFPFDDFTEESVKAYFKVSNL